MIPQRLRLPCHIAILMAMACEGVCVTPWKLSFSGHARTMQESYRNIEFGLGDIKDDFRPGLIFHK